MTAKPSRYGKLRRFRSPFPSSRGVLDRALDNRRYQKHMRGRFSRDLGGAVNRLGSLRAERSKVVPLVERNRETVAKTHRALRLAFQHKKGLAPERVLLEKVAKRALSLGVSTASLAVAPGPVKVIRTALRAVNLAKEMTRDRDRGRGR